MFSRWSDVAMWLIELQNSALYGKMVPICVTHAFSSALKRSFAQKSISAGYVSVLEQILYSVVNDNHMSSDVT
jgi:hypothetical protein